MTSNGLLLVDKPRGVTSHDVVARVRRLMDERRVGHAGTLDPMATGLLVLAIGASTRLLRFAQSGTKIYEGVVTFGVRTDSLDADGEVVERREVPELDSTQVNAVAASMLGPQAQIPPMVSAVKVQGRRLHAMAREGLVVDRAPREVEVHEFSLSVTDDPVRWSFRVACSAGTYVRVLLSDLAERLGTLGHLSVLRRVKSGPYDVADALTLDELERQVLAHSLVVQPPRALVAQLEAIVVDRDDVQRLRHGQRVGLSARESGEVAVVNASGALVAVVQRRGDEWQPVVVLPDGEFDEHE